MGVTSKDPRIQWRLTLPDERRCTGHTGKDDDGNPCSPGNRCTNARLVGLEVCGVHGGNTKASKAKSARAKARIELEKLVMEDMGMSSPFRRELYAVMADEPPHEAIMMELKRGRAMIMYYEQKLALLEDSEIIGLMMVEQTDSDSTGNTLIGDIKAKITTNRVTINILLDELKWERVQQVKVAKIAIDAGIQARQLALQEAQLLDINRMVIGVVQAMGKDPSDPEVMDKVRRVMMGISSLRTPNPVIEGITR